MGKLRASLLSLVIHLCLIPFVLANEEVRKVQEELRKRHLFSGNPNGQVTPALSAAVARYQGIKGFARTGIIDGQLCASLGLIEPVAPAGIPPFVVENGDGVRGANGEQLPISVFMQTNDDRAVQFERAMMQRDRNALALPGSSLEPGAETQSPAKRPSGNRVRRAAARKETNPFAIAFQTVDRAIKLLRGDADPKKKRAAKRL
ncbi:MAG TPA: peptidoglycan-binding domain-containing protein [Chthoniobacterales bacterium]|jgi:peptidoglycan hydrolase-like protein with peptidoglycan-binding domain|nr:peptidoglycan-binding domain-containing protein [Chthoniobacterales bacterium]